VLFLCPDANGDGIDSWIIVSCALVMAAGTPAGLAHRQDARPQNGQAAPDPRFRCPLSSATILSLAAQFAMPVSPTHSISTAIMGGALPSARAR
jgi:PiT family inorganic phosphate transporter